MSLKSLRDRCAIVGVGESPLLHRSERPYKEYQLEAIRSAIADAGMVPSDIDGIITDQMVTAPLMPIEEVVASLKMSNIGFISFTQRAGCGVVSSPLLASQAILQGTCKNILFYFGNDWGSNGGAAYSAHHEFRVKMPFEAPYGFFGQPVYFATYIRRYQQQYGYSEEQMTKGLGAVAVAAHKHANLNPGAQTYGKPFAMDDYHRSRILATPLRAADCCLLSDGGGAYVITSSDRAKDCPKPPVYVMGINMSVVPVSMDSALTQLDFLFLESARLASGRALEMAGVTIKDVDFIQLYDCFTISALVQMESLGLCRKGEGIQYVQGGRVEIGGEMPVNTHGGLLAHSYTLMMSHVVEAVHQLRHEAGAAQVKDAEIAMVTADPGPVHSTLILRR